MVLCRPSDSDIVNSVGKGGYDTADIGTKLSAAEFIARDSPPITGCSAVATSLDPPLSSTELGNIPSSSAVRVFARVLRQRTKALA